MSTHAKRMAAMLRDFVNLKPGPGAPKLPAEMAVLLPGADADPLPSPEDVEVDVNVGQAVGIEYQDSAGAFSRRVVTILRVKPGPEALLAVTWCYMRAAYRSFRVDRITALIDLQTGTIESERDDIERAFAILLQTRLADGYETTRMVIDRAGPAINILTYLSRCDGRVHPGETQAILSFLDAIATDLNLPLNETVARRLAARMHVTPEMFNRSLNRLARLDATTERRLMLAIRRLVDADGWLAPEEAAALIELGNMI